MGNMGMAMSEMAEKYERMDRRSEMDGASNPSTMPRRPSLMEVFDQQVAEYEQLLNQLMEKLSPVLQQRVEKAMGDVPPHEAPLNHLDERLDSLAIMNRRLRSIVEDIFI